MTFEEIKSKLKLTAKMMAFDIEIDSQIIGEAEIAYMAVLGNPMSPGKVNTVSVEMNNLEPKAIVEALVKGFELTETESRNLVAGIMYVECD